MEAAARIVRRDGVRAIDTNRIAARAGVSIGTLYGYFPDKTAILVALARRILAEDREALLAALGGDPAEDPIRLLVRALLSRHRSDSALRRAVMGVHIGAGGGGEHTAQVDQVVESLAERSAELFGRRLPTPDRMRLFVATRAALGVARALAEERVPELPEAALEDEVVRLVSGYLQGAAAAFTPSTSPPPRTSGTRPPPR